MKKTKIAITHAGGMLAEALLEQLSKSAIKPDSVDLLGQQEHVGTRLAYSGTYLTVQDQYEYDYEDLTAVLLLQADAELESLLQHADCFVLSHHPQEKTTPVFIDAVDSQEQLSAKPCAIKLASAQLATLLTVVKPLQTLVDLHSLQIVNVLSASSYGKKAIDELASQAIELLSGRAVNSSVFPLQLAFNMLPLEPDPLQELHIQTFLGADTKCCVQNIVVSAFHGLAISVVIETAQAIDMTKVKKLLKTIQSVKVIDGPVSPLTHCKSGKKQLIYGLNQPQKDAKRLQFWLLADSVRNGLVQNYLNAFEILLKSYL